MSVQTSSKDTIGHLVFKETAIKSITEFTEIALQMFMTDTMIGTSNKAFYAPCRTLRTWKHHDHKQHALLKMGGDLERFHDHSRGY